MKTTYNYDTLSEALNSLNERGYTVDLQFCDPNKKSLLGITNTSELQPEEFTIDEIYRFEGMTDPGDSMILYAISSSVKNIKGFLLNGYGLYADTLVSKIIKKLVRKR